MSSSPDTDSRPRICFLGPMIGRRHGFAISQGLVLENYLEREGYSVVSASDCLNRYARLADILATIARYRRSIDVICLEVYGGPSFVVEDLASLAATIFRIPLVMILHGGALPDFMQRHPHWTRGVLKRASRLVAPSPYLQRAVAVHGFRAQVIPNLIDLESYPHRHREKVRPKLFWMRSFHPVYNPNLAVRALAIIKARVPDASLVMAGQSKGAEYEVTALAQSLGLADSVHFPGFLDQSGKCREGNAADVFINTNRVDNMPVAVLEAGAMGLPVVATAVGGVPDLLSNGRDGILVPDDDPRAMAESVLSLLADPARASRYSRNARQLAERSSWRSVQPHWAQLFHQVCPRH
jgi:L-malate glycosyltransferase